MTTQTVKQMIPQPEVILHNKNLSQSSDNLWEAPVLFKLTENHHPYQSVKQTSANKMLMVILPATNLKAIRKYFTHKITKVFLQHRSIKKLQRLTIEVFK